jgi:osmotically-inducible protein OsmY
LSLQDRVDSVIQGSPYLSGRNLRFETEEGRVTLKGVVSTYFQKQMAQEALRKIDGITAIENELEVTWA